MLEKTGIPTKEMIMGVFPSIDKINKGPVAVVECYQNIPCNPCQTACKFNAIYIGDDINNLPELNEDNCTGCGICLSKCPGLSIMVVDGSKSQESVLVKIPYEFLPLPTVGNTVQGLDRTGEHIADVKVVNVLNPKSFDRTPVITIEVDRKYLYDIRNIRVEVL
ncbi:MAG TPA: 4Fe-4S ferredoxin [Clostridiales bacterium]|nr:4Fe-4S ferredoxin [Clostridiales bacterium]